MRCKTHLTDVSSSVGVCASCLRQRLFALIQAQLQANAQPDLDDRRLSDATPPPLLFPRSASPYISRRKSDTAATWQDQRHAQPQHYPQTTHALREDKFFSTPQVAPAGSIADYHSQQQQQQLTRKKKKNRFSLISTLFRSKSKIPYSVSDPDPSRISNSRDSSLASPSWFSGILPRRRQKQMRTSSIDESSTKPRWRPGRKTDRGMSPAFYSDEEDNDEHCRAGSSGYSSESSQGWKQTPRRTPAPGRRGSRPNHNRNMSGIAFCLSPLVRASPNWHWSHKGVPPEVVVSGGDVRAPVKPHLSNASSFCKNRSRKLADFGRFNRNH